MAELWTFSTMLREKCDDDIDLRKCLQAIANKYLSNEKMEMEAQNAHEENLMLKIEVGNLESISRMISENNTYQAELDSLLKQYYQEHLKAAFDIGECEIEKLYSYEELKLELETRETINMYQQLYKRRMETAKKMDERNIVKKYRQKEQEYLNTQNERLHLEEKIKELREKAKEQLELKQKLNKLIVQLAKGALDLETIFAKMYPEKSKTQNKNLRQGQLSEPIDEKLDSNEVQLVPTKSGLSSRMLIDFQRFQMPSIPALSRIRKIEKNNGLNRLLQQAEVIRKSMKTNLAELPYVPQTSKLSGILKTSKEIPKLTEVPIKSVSFEISPKQEELQNSLTEDELPITIDSTMTETPADPDVNISADIKSEPKKSKIEILENIVIKPPNIISEVNLPDSSAEGPEVKQKTTTKRRVEFNVLSESPPPKKCHTEQMGSEPKSASFMDMFLEFSKETPIASPAFETINIDENIEIMKKKRLNEDANKKKEPTKGTKAKFVDFDNFFSQMDGNDSDGKESDMRADMSFDFFDGNGITEDGDNERCSDNFSFKF